MEEKSLEPSFPDELAARGPISSRSATRKQKQESATIR